MPVGFAGVAGFRHVRSWARAQARALSTLLPPFLSWRTDELVALSLKDTAELTVTQPVSWGDAARDLPQGLAVQ